MALAEGSKWRTARSLAVAAVCAALLLAAAPAVGSDGAVTPKDGLYKGRTAQGHPVKFRVRRGSVLPGVLFTISGPGGCRMTAYVLSRAKIATNGKFTLRSDLLSMRVSGRFVGATSVRGTLSDPECISAARSVPWSARRASS